jgi:aryl-alcohol dehydrogenase-like predicted oxidoreductase
MRQHSFGNLAPVSTLTLGGGGLGMLWGPTTFDECVATVHAAVDAGITLFDLAPRYGDGKAEEVAGTAFGGRLPTGVRVTSKCNLGNSPPAEIEATLRRSIEGSLRRLRLAVDLFFLHSNVVPDEAFAAAWGDAGSRMTPYGVFVAHVRPVFESCWPRG